MVVQQRFHYILWAWLGIIIAKRPFYLLTDGVHVLGFTIGFTMWTIYQFDRTTYVFVMTYHTSRTSKS